MKFLPLLLTLLPFVYANRVHKLKLHKIPPVASNVELESGYLAEKYGAPQLPLLGAGGSGRSMKRPTMRDGEQLLWTQEQINGGHPVPLSSTPFLPVARVDLFRPHIDFMNAQYFTEINLGSPPQKVSQAYPGCIALS